MSLDEQTLSATGDLADQLELGDADDRAPSIVDPRTIPTRFSLLKLMNASPAHYWEGCQRDQDDTMASRLGAFASDRKEAFRVGSAIHAMITGVGKIDVYPGRRDPRTKAWKDFQANAAAEGVTEILSPKEMDLVKGVSAAILSRADAMALLFDGTLVEKRIDWSWMGRAVRSTPDARATGRSVDLKTAITSEPRAFARQARKLFYHAQADLYGRAMEENGEGRPGNAYAIAVEKARPYPVTIFRFTGELLELGAKMNRIWIERLLQCERANVWPVYAPSPTVVDLDVEEEWGGSLGIEADGRMVEVEA